MQRKGFAGKVEFNHQEKTLNFLVQVSRDLFLCSMVDAHEHIR
jgi:hypothetical protein